MSNTQTRDGSAFTALRLAEAMLREAKPADRSPKARRYTVTITELEKVVAYFKTWVVDDLPESDGS